MTPAQPYSAFPNQFRRNLIAGQKLTGCWCALGSPISTEVLGLAGFDWILLDGEHAPNDVLSFIPQLMALKDSVSAPVVRPASNDAVLTSACSTSASTTSSCPSWRAPKTRPAP
jgi:2-dehydro-3-deoxyglucarate aldolase